MDRVFQGNHSGTERGGYLGPVFFKKLSRLTGWIDPVPSRFDPSIKKAPGLNQGLFLWTDS
jgi:hypothetical protein